MDWMAIIGLYLLLVVINHALFRLFRDIFEVPNGNIRRVMVLIILIPVIYIPIIMLGMAIPIMREIIKDIKSFMAGTG